MMKQQEARDSEFRMSDGDASAEQAAHPEQTAGLQKDGSEGIPENVLRVLDGPASTPLEEPAADAISAPSEAFGNLGIGTMINVRDDDVDVMVGGRIITARCNPALHLDVLKTALSTGEPVLIERNPDGSVLVIGALRTRPTPGVDAMTNVTIEADHIHLRGRKEVSLTAGGVASLALRAAGEIETYADRIVSRAEELHKIVGRMLRLN